MRFFVLMFMIGCSIGTAMADKTIFYMSPTRGMYKCLLDESDPAKSKWELVAADAVLIADGGKTPPGTPPVPNPPDEPETDPAIKQITAISWTALSNKEQATAAAAVVDMIGKLNLSETEFAETMHMAIGVADTQLGFAGKLDEWWKLVSKISLDPAKIKAGVSATWDAADLESIQEAVSGGEITGEAINWAKLIEVLKLLASLIDLLKIGGDR